MIRFKNENFKNKRLILYLETAYMRFHIGRKKLITEAVFPCIFISGEIN